MIDADYDKRVQECIDAMQGIHNPILVRKVLSACKKVMNIYENIPEFLIPEMVPIPAVILSEMQQSILDMCEKTE
jgi:hypothetical protein